MPVGVAARVELRQGALDVAAVDQAALGEPGVHLDAEARRGTPRTCSIISSIPRAPTASRSSGSIPSSAICRRQLDHVLALVAVLGRLLAAHPGGDRAGEVGDLGPGVVDVVLALDLVADRRQQPHHRVAVGRPAAAADVQRAGRVGGDELDQDPFRGRRSGPGRGRRPAASRTASARRYQASARKRLTKPGPATSTRSRLPASPPRLPSSSPRRRSATARGLSPSGPASSIAAFEL